MNIYGKMIEQCKKIMDQYVMGKLWTIAAYDEHKALMGRSNSFSFKFIRKRLSWYAPHLTLPIEKGGRITSVFMVSGKMRWDITKNTKWDKPRYRCGEELDIDDIVISVQTY